MPRIDTVIFEPDARDFVVLIVQVIFGELNDLLHVAGIVRPQDISRENTIAYDKIAEARISYGGRGRIMEVQQPAVLQQIYDRLKPF